MRFFGPVPATILMLAATLGATKLADQRQPNRLALPLEHIPTAIDGYAASQDPRIAENVLDKLLATSYLSRTYHQGAHSIHLFVAYYAQQRAGESMHSPQHCLPGGGWQIIQRRTVAVPVGAKMTDVNQYTIRRDGEQMIVLYWYQSPGRVIANEYTGKFALLYDSIFKGQSAGSIVRIMLPDNPDALDQAVGFAGQVIPAMEECFEYSS